MAKLTINGQKVTVDDSFLSLSPEQQDATVDEIAKSLGGGQPAPVTDASLSAETSAAHQKFWQNPEPQAAPNNMMTSTAATLNGIVNGIPVIGPAAQNLSDAMMGTGAQLTGGDYGDTVRGLQTRREELARGAPIASVAGNIGGGVASMGLAGLTATGANAIGGAGSLGPRILNSGLSTLGLGTADNMVRGQGGMEAAGNAAGPAALAAAIPVVGAGIKKGAQSIADAVTNAAQRHLTTGAVKGAPTSGELKSAASQMFENATGGEPLAVSDNAFFRFLGGVQENAKKLRINQNLDPKAVGVMEMLMQVGDDVAQGGVAVDMKDLHIIRQAAQKVAMSADGRDAAFANTVIRQLDGFIQTLKPSDILGGADPSQAANNLMKGISTWSRASKVGMIEDAIKAGQIAAAGPEKGIRNALRAIAKKPDVWKRFTVAEQKAIMDVVDGTGTSNLLKLIGTFGFGANTATNGIGGAAGIALGGMAGGPLGMVAGPIIGSVAKNASERVTQGLADRAIGAVANGNVPIAVQRQVPKALTQGVDLTELLARGTTMSGNKGPIELTVRGGR